MTSNGTTSSGAQAFCLRRTSHYDDLMTDFGQMLDNEDLVDVTLSCDDGCLNAHRMFLAANSPYFKGIFAKLALSPNKSQYPVIILRDVSFSDLKAILDFIYRGEVTVPQNQLASVLKAAEGLKIRGLNAPDIPSNVAASKKRKKRKKRKRRDSKGSSDGEDGDEGKGGGTGGGNDSNGGGSDMNDDEDGSGNDLLSNDDDDEEDYPRTHITPVNDDRNSVSTVGDLEPSRLLEQTMTVSGMDSLTLLVYLFCFSVSFLTHLLSFILMSTYMSYNLFSSLFLH